jgi:hypothetical protein
LCYSICEDIDLESKMRSTSVRKSSSPSRSSSSAQAQFATSLKPNTQTHFNTPRKGDTLSRSEDISFVTLSMQSPRVSSFDVPLPFSSPSSTNPLHSSLFPQNSNINESPRLSDNLIAMPTSFTPQLSPFTPQLSMPNKNGNRKRSLDNDIIGGPQQLKKKQRLYVLQFVKTLGHD